MPCIRLLFCGAILCIAARAASSEWRPVSLEDLALTQSKSDPNAEAECLFKDVRINDEAEMGSDRSITTYIRFKIFSERGRDKYSNRTISFLESTRISDLQGRTIHRDGQIIELTKEDILKKLAAKTKGVKLKAISFALPDVEAGSIIEYRWTATAPMATIATWLAPYYPLEVQEEFPVDEVTFHLKPRSQYIQASLRYIPFGCKPELNAKEGKGFASLTVRNVAAFHEEPYSPPVLITKQWLLVWYDFTRAATNEQYWASFAATEMVNLRLLEVARSRTKSDDSSDAATRVTANAKTDDEKLGALAAYCHTQDVTNRMETVLNFIKMARGAGFEAHFARVAPRNRFVFDPAVSSAYFPSDYRAAVRLGGKWKFFDLSGDASPAGTLPWYEQGVWALVVDVAPPQWTKTEILSADQTKRERIAEFTLSENGDLEGDARELLYGNHGIQWRERYAKANTDEREEPVREGLKKRFSDFEVTNIQFTMPPDPKLPIGIRYHIVVRSYAQKTGKRLFFRPGYFTAGSPAVFNESERKNNIYFEYPWSEEDAVEIHLPKDFELDHGDRPPSIETPFCQESIRMTLQNPTKTLSYQRRLKFGGADIPWFDRKGYGVMKALFEQIHINDDHLLTLKVVETPIVR